MPSNTQNLYFSRESAEVKESSIMERECSQHYYYQMLHLPTQVYREIQYNLLPLRYLACVFNNSKYSSIYMYNVKPIASLRSQNENSPFHFLVTSNFTINQKYGKGKACPDCPFCQFTLIIHYCASPIQPSRQSMITTPR